MQIAKKYTSPFGKAVYPHLNKADVRFKAEGEFKVDLEVDGDEASELKLLINHLAEESLKQAQEKAGKKSIKKAQLPFKEEDGKVIFKFKMKASGTNKKTGDSFKQRPALFDSELKPINPEETLIWGGSKLRVSWKPLLWFTPMLGAGVSLKLQSVQVKELVEGSTTGGADGFDKVEGYATNTNASNASNENEEVSEEDGDF